MGENFVLDTNALINYFHEVFDEAPRLTPRARSIIENGFNEWSKVKLSIPSVVFLEIFEKWYRDEEFAARFRAEVLHPIENASKIEIRPIDQEVLENLLSIKGVLSNHEINDKIILASAITLQVPLITMDPVIHEYVSHSRVIPHIIS